MTVPAEGGKLRYRSFVLLVLGTGVLLAAIGYFPTRRWAGDEGVQAMLAGCAIAVVGSWLGAAPLVSRRGAPANMLTLVMASTALRLLVVVVLSVAAGLSGLFPTTPLLVWVAISYLGLLVLDTLFAVRAAGHAGSAQAAERPSRLDSSHD